MLFIGDLGAGKTTFIKQLLRELGSTDLASSPSFSLINEYSTKSAAVYHIDLYRLEDATDVFNLGIEEYLYGKNFCFIEWPQIILEYLEKPYHILKIDIIENNARKITLM